MESKKYDWTLGVAQAVMPVIGLAQGVAQAVMPEAFLEPHILSI